MREGGRYGGKDGGQHTRSVAWYGVGAVKDT